ncbi:DUF2087 domain-containing protein [Curtobacterium sp. VKM Ac-1395]|jgi:hypothetical protein|uniref:DUF2087 domain-containing protein n=1 Tax=Curtobacterium sp. VKM Ac-1395 TaxID=2783815 RepID=UPI00188D58A3|nr:DUF2087 domain-containing protein [Curtobacterium sp. VKM Ac-1395]MBF4589847.1 DUF2087 domain-containing protein [Curtobacterium sp. VKM Ac-1395]
MASTDAGDWRPIVAALANDDVRAVHAQIVLGLPVSLGSTAQAAARRDKSLQTLLRAGLIEEAESESGSEYVASSVPLKRALAAQAPERKRGIERFLRDGRIQRYPSNPSERAELLRWVAERTLTNGEVLSERDINERLRPVDDDTARLRRYLVDLGVVERTPSGSDYRLRPRPPG